LKYRELGNTDLQVSSIGFGGVPINRICTDRAVRTMHRAFDLGINFIDTARSYGDSEEKIGKALNRYPSHNNIILASKSKVRSAVKMKDEVDRSLRAMNTDYIHLYQIHDLRENDLDKVTAPGGALEALDRARKEGKIGHIGVSGHRPQALIPAMKAGIFETVQMPLNIIDHPLFSDNIPVATEHSLGIIVMKPLCGGLMESPVQALKFVLSHPVSTAIPGMDSPQQVEENARVGCQDIEFSKSDLANLKKEAAELGKDFCRRCGYCDICPAGLDIPDVFRFDRYYTSYFAENWARDQYSNLEVTVDDCLDCGKCEEVCPYQLPIRDKLQMAHERLTSESN